MSDKRIIEYDTASKLEDDDYLLLDSVTGGTCKILAKPLEPVRPHIVSIEAVYVQSGTVYDTDTLDSLKTDLTVTAYYDNETSKIVTDYTLSGTLEVGTSTITVSYKGFTDTFDVTVSSSITYLYNWDFTQSLTDSVQGVTATLRSVTFAEGTGLVFNSAKSGVTLLPQSLNRNGQTIEIDIASMSKGFADTGLGRIIMATAHAGFMFRPETGYWECYNGDWKSYIQTSNDYNAFNGKILKVIINNIATDIEVYADSNLIYKGAGWQESSTSIYIGSFNSVSGNAYYNMTIKAVRIYANQ